MWPIDVRACLYSGHAVFVHETGGITKSLLSVVLHKCVWCNEVAAVARIVRW